MQVGTDPFFFFLKHKQHSVQKLLQHKLRGSFPALLEKERESKFRLRFSAVYISIQQQYGLDGERITPYPA